MSNELTIGATAAGLVFKDGVVLAADKRVSYGYTVLSRSGRKVFQIGDNLGMASVGLVGDMQTLARAMTAEVKIYVLENKRQMSVRGAAKLLANILYGSKLMPYYTEVLIGGLDETGPHVYTMDAIGSVLEDSYAALGNGAPVATGILDSQYQPDMSRTQAEELVLKAVRSAIARDITSGDGVDLLTITASGSELKEYPASREQKV